VLVAAIRNRFALIGKEVASVGLFLAVVGDKLPPVGRPLSIFSGASARRACDSLSTLRLQSATRSASISSISGEEVEPIVDRADISAMISFVHLVGPPVGRIVSQVGDALPLIC